MGACGPRHKPSLATIFSILRPTDGNKLPTGPPRPRRHECTKHHTLRTPLCTDKALWRAAKRKCTMRFPTSIPGANSRERGTKQPVCQSVHGGGGRPVVRLRTAGCTKTAVATHPLGVRGDRRLWVQGAHVERFFTTPPQSDKVRTHVPGTIWVSEGSGLHTE
jgi:hypothetical protein